MPTDLTTGRSLPDTTILRPLYTHTPIHIYAIPPLTSTQGFSASSWTALPRPTAQQIFTAQLQILETSDSSCTPPLLKIDIVLTDPSTGELFAAAPYTSAAVIQQANDSSRFFAIRVVGEGGMKATLGMGFEERGAAFDFGVALGEARKVLGWGGMENSGGGGGRKGRAAAAMETQQKQLEAEAKKDWSLKEGEKIVVNVPGGAGRRKRPDAGSAGGGGREGDDAALFSIAPPPLAAGAHAKDESIEGKTAQELGFDDGEFGEFQ